SLYSTIKSSPRSSLIKTNQDEIPNSEFDLTEGDMILTPRQKEILYSVSDTRNVAKNPSLKWPNGIVHYQFASSIPSKTRDLVLTALHEIEKATCVRFREGANSENNYILVTNNVKGCFSHVGYGRYVQRLNLSNGCLRKGKIIHEFLHAIGFYHQQSSSNRDDFVEIHIENVKSGHEHNFKKYSSSKVTNFGLQYDYESIMHYGPYTFSVNGEPTIVAKQEGAENMGQRFGLSKSDVLKINRLYGCN
uniref:Metalloendopeptidase n=1 Tax=Megaselia scalaris TaxID=36166 RepID=T1GKM2_MEGSC